MENEYYGILTNSSSDFLAHYGVKGMKWGVRRAINSGNSAQLTKNYNRALKKLKKLNNNADVSRQQREVKGRLHNAAAAGVAGGVNAGIAAALNAARVSGGGWLPLGAGIAAADAGYQLARAGLAKSRTKGSGHEKALAKRDAFKSEMKKTFKGTKYASLPGSDSKGKAYQYSSAKKQIRNAAVDSMISPRYTVSKEASNEIRRRKRR